MLCCLLLPLWCAAVEPYAPKIADPILEPWRWRTEEALGDLGVLCMTEAEDGTLWFGNVGSVARYDGLQVTTIPFSEELLSNMTHRKEVPWAKSLLVLPDGKLLVQMGDRLVSYKNGEWNIVIKNIGPAAKGSDLIQAPNGTIWMLVQDGLWRISPDLSETLLVRQPPGSIHLMALCLDAQGDLWVVEKEGAGRRLIHLVLENDLPREDPGIFPIPLPDMFGKAFLVSANNGLIRYVDQASESVISGFDPKRKEWVPVHEDNIPLASWSLLKSRDGTIWSGSLGCFMRLSPDGKFTFYTNEQLGLEMLPFSVYETQDGRLWVIGHKNTVYSLDPETDEWMTYDGLNFQCETEEGVQWFLPENRDAVVSYDPKTGKWLQYGKEEGLNDISALFDSSHGLIWAAGRKGSCAGLFVFNGTEWIEEDCSDFAAWIEPNSFFEAANGTVWFGAGGPILAGVSTTGGALQYKVNDDRSVERVKQYTQPKFPYYVTSIEQTPNGAIWLGSTTVYQYDGISDSSGPTAGLLGDNSADLAVDQGGALWVAKENCGVGRWNGATWDVFKERDGVAGLLLSNLLVLRDGSVLAASNRGISRFDGSTWTASAYPESFAMRSRWSSLRESADGSLWFNFNFRERPTSQMIVSKTKQHRAVRYCPETDPPETRIVESLNRVAQPGNTHVSWAAHDLWSRTSVKELQYSWRLDGGEWSAFSFETGRTFLKLNSGAHRLEVRARDRAFNVDPTPAWVLVTVFPPLWKHAWVVFAPYHVRCGSPH
jgi:streptogramin lyase